MERQETKVGADHSRLRGEETRPTDRRTLAVHSLAYEARAFYTPVEDIATRSGGGVAVARGWRVERLEDGEAELRAVDDPELRARLRFEQCLLATGARAAETVTVSSDRVLRLRSLEDAARLARGVCAADAGEQGARVAVVGGGLLATELAASLALAPPTAATDTATGELPLRY